MPAQRLPTIRVEKPWGRHELWQSFENVPPSADPVGEIWFDAAGDPELLVKYLFTSERLSIQVHPDDHEARARGHRRGKDECWIILGAEPGATIGLGTVRPLSQEELRAAAADGSIEELMAWKPVKAGDVIYSPAKTVHAIGAGLTLIEIQQNVDLTYRLYDYGRPRELHLGDGAAVADAGPFAVPPVPGFNGEGRQRLAETGKFVLERWRWSGARSVTLGAPGWLIPVTGGGQLDGQAFAAGQCWLVEQRADLSIAPESDVLFASPKDFSLA